MGLFQVNLFKGSAGAADSVLFSPHYALVLSGLGQAVPCRAEPVDEGMGGETSSSGEFRLAECDGQLQVLLLLLGEPGKSLLFLSLALALCPLHHVFLCWILLHEHRKHTHTEKTHTHKHTHKGEGENTHICEEIWGEETKTYIQLKDSQGYISKRILRAC